MDLYNIFYNSNDELKQEKVKDFLLADKESMMDYIRRLGKIEKDKSAIMLKQVFKYENFSKRKSAYEMLKKMEVNVCPYCNRQYTFTLISKTRPQFDHYFPKSIYPYLALCLHNLIPCCGTCNLAKSSFDTYENPFPYLYEEEFGNNIKFRIKENDLSAMQGLSDNFMIEIKNVADKDGILPKSIENQVNTLNLNKLYEMHKDYIQDLKRNYYMNSMERIEEILSIFPNLYKSKDDVRQVMMMNYFEKDNLGKRPLAKLTNDICDELDAWNMKK